ncbi:hypothetical protein N836_14265 [Leptolyngbya sp. Heron Island J]|nr:hypothetical protein N836_14265 [Leptolyngbya sp. Heron Island J]
MRWNGYAGEAEKVIPDELEIQIFLILPYLSLRKALMLRNLLIW